MYTWGKRFPQRFCRNKTLGKMFWRITIFWTLMIIGRSSQSSFTHPSIHSKVVRGEENRQGVFYKQKWQAAALDSSPEENNFVIEISFADSSLQEALRSYLNNLSFPLLVNMSDSAVKISSINVTTVCNSTISNTTHCYCEHGYGWSPNACKANPACSDATEIAVGESCKCLALTPSQGAYCLPQSADNPSLHIIKMSFRLDQPFPNALWDSSSVLFKKYKYDLENVLTVAYQSLPGFRTVEVTGFRRGSIVVQYEITSAGVIPVESANARIAEALDDSYNLINTSFAKEITGGVNFSISPEHVFEGDTVKMTCESTSTSTNVTWSLSGHLLSSSRHSVMNEIKDGKSTSTLTITSIKLNEAGDYSCTFTEWRNDLSLLYKAVDNVIVSQIKIVQSDNVSIVCNGESKELSCCTDEDILQFTSYWKPNGSINISGSTTSTHNCTMYLLQANEFQCPADKSGSKTNYICELNTTYGARTNRVISVTYFRVANVTMYSSSSPSGKVSKGHRFSVTCFSDVSNYDKVIWQIQSGNSTKEVDSMWFTTIKTQSGAESVLTVGNANEDWAGTYICTFSQSFLNSSAYMKIEVFPLPLKQDIMRDPIEAFVSCPVNQVLKCCISKQENYTVAFYVQNRSSPVTREVRNEGSLYCYYYRLTIKDDSCSTIKHAFEVFCEFTNQIAESVKSAPMTLNVVPGKSRACNSSDIGIGENGALITKPCLQSQEKSNVIRGNITYKCDNTKWTVARNSCLTIPINNLLTSAESLVSSPESVKNLPTYLEHLNATVKKEQQNINTSVANLKAVVEILNLVSVIPVYAKQTTVENFLSTVDTIMSTPTETWNDFKNGSSHLLGSVEQFSRSLQPINNTIPPARYGNIQLAGTVIEQKEDYNKSFTFSTPSSLSGSVLIDETKLKNGTSVFTIISVAYSALDHIIAQYNKREELVNGLVLSTVVNDSSKLKEDFQISMTFAKREKTLRNPRCVFWNVTLSADGGGWDDTGCESKENGDSVICSCNHLTSFSILMSPSHENTCDTLTYVTYIGLGISILSLVACIGIELVVWKSVTKTRISYMRHVCILNIAISLLIADIWFLVVAAMHDQNYEVDQKICTAATFFIHYFYLCVFFWMLTLGLMLFYHLVFILHNTSKTIMKTVGFCLGYLCPLAISVITIASTISRDSYTKKNICLLNWEDSRALLALVIPAMVIVAINAVVTIVVVAKISRRSIGEKSISEEKKYLYRITKSIGVLTPLLGLTWGFGLATVFPESPSIFHILFTIFNAFQGLFIFLCGTLWDRKVREAVMNKFSLSRWSLQHSKSSSQGMSAPMLSISSPFSKTLNNLFGKAGKYQVSSTESASSSSENTSKAYSLLT